MEVCWTPADLVLPSCYRRLEGQYLAHYPRLFWSSRLGIASCDLIRVCMGHSVEIAFLVLLELPAAATVTPQ